MTPKEKAEELANKMLKVGCRAMPESERHSAKQSARIAVNEIMETIKELTGTDEHLWSIHENDQITFWKEVKKEIEKL